MSLAINKMSERPQPGTFLHPATLISSLKSLLPYPALENLSLNSSSLILKEQTFYTAFLKCLGFSAANNFAGLDDFALQKMFDLLKIGFNQNHLVLRRFLPTRAYKALARKVFEYAIQTGKEHIVEYLLEDQSSDIHTTTPVGYLLQDQSYYIHTNTPFEYRPIYLCYYHQHVAVAKVLLRHGADAKMRFSGKHSRIDPELVSILLEAGATFGDNVLENLITYGNIELVRRIIRMQGCNHSRWTKHRLCHRFLMEVDSNLALKIVRIIVSIGIDINQYLETSSENGYSHIKPGTMLDIASQREWFEVVQKLLYSNAVLSKDTLKCAVVSGNQKLVHFLIDRGANVGEMATSRSSPFTSSPFTEAVRTGNAELGRLLAQSGALRHIKTQSSRNSHLEIAMQAASAAGNIGISRALHKIAEDIRCEWPIDITLAEVLIRALTEAIKHDQTELALDLIRREVLVTHQHLSLAISQENILVARAILNVGDFAFGSDGICIMTEAIKLGNHSLIKDLIVAGAGVCPSSYMHWKRQTFELKSDFPLATAAENGDMEMAKL